MTASSQSIIISPMAETSLQPLPQDEQRIKKISYTHDAMIDLIIANPAISQNELAALFGYTPGWVSLVKNSDAFQARLEARKADLVDPTIRMTLEEKFKALAAKSLEVLQKKLEAPSVSDNLAVAAANLAAKSLGLGQPKNTPTPPPNDDRLDRIGGRLLALMGNKVLEANRSLDYEIIDAQSKGSSLEVVPAQGSLPGESAPGTGTTEAAG